MSEPHNLRDHWECDNCGAGSCVPAGEPPTSNTHRRCDGCRCGTYQLVEANVDCFAEVAV